MSESTQDNGSPCCEATQEILIIGSGSAAFAAAIKAAETNARVILVEAQDRIGGTCVNVGCVPSKIMIRAAQLAQQQRSNPFQGLENHAPGIDRKALLRQQMQRVTELREAKYESILASNEKISLVQGRAAFANADTLVVTQKDGQSQEFSPDKILIATGSQPSLPPIQGLEDVPYWTSTEALEAASIPDHLIVIGSSVVAVELAQAWRRLGAEVTLLARHRLLYREDPALGEGLTQVFAEEGLRVLANTVANSVSHDGALFQVETATETLRADALLVATGRPANTGSLNLQAAGVEASPEGSITVDPRMQTSNPKVFAAGDCTTQPQFVYVAAAAGTRAAINMTGGVAELDLSTLPAVIFTDPAIATVGLTETEARNTGLSVESRRLDLENIPRALANFDNRGFVNLVAEKATGRLVGAQILAPEAGEMIQSVAIAMRNQMTTRSLADQLFPYLTMVEGVKLCAQTFFKNVNELSCCAG